MLMCQVMLTAPSSMAKHKKSSLMRHCSRRC